MSVSFSTHTELEFDPRYNELDFVLARLDANNDPLDPAVQEEISWPLINDQSQQLLAIGFDWRVLLWQLRAKLHLQGCSALWECLNAAEQAFIQLPENDEARALAATGLGWLAGNQCLASFKHSPLTPDSVLTLEHLQQRRLHEESTTLNFPESVSLLAAAEEWYRQHRIPALQEQLHDCLKMLDGIEINANKSVSDYQFQPNNLRHYLQATLRCLQEDVPANVDELAASSIPPTQVISAAGGKLQNRRDAILMLDNVLDYFAQHEPSHPAPVFLRRARKMIGMDFVEIIEEMLPDAMSTLQQFSGKA